MNRCVEQTRTLFLQQMLQEIAVYAYPRISLFAISLLLLLLSSNFAETQTASNRPNLDIHTYRRCYTPDEMIALNVNLYNEKKITLNAYRFSLPALTPNSRALEDFGKRIRTLDLHRLTPVKIWPFVPPTFYPNQWIDQAVNMPHLSPGVYLIVASGSGATKRTWLAITSIALTAKRSRQELLVYAAQAHSGRPVAGLSLTCTDTQGTKVQGRTDAQGVCRLAWADRRGNAWIYGEQNGSPAFLLSGEPAAPDPLVVYTYTDRPIYRPGHLVRFKGTIRRRLDSDAPGGFTYNTYDNRPVSVEIRDSTDALLTRSTLITNAYGSFDGTFQLAAEPSLGHWQIVVSVENQRSYAGFEVQAYRKPEFMADVRFAQPHTPGGSSVSAIIAAKYYFGQPVAGAAVQYVISFAPAGGYVAGNSTTEPSFNGQGVTNAQGELPLEIKTQRLPLNRLLSIQATVIDLSRRQMTASGSVLITAGRFQLRLETDRAIYHTGDPIRVTVHAEDYDNRPVPTRVQIRWIEELEDRLHRPYREITRRETTTGPDGAGTVAFTPVRPGYREIQAEAFDSDGSKIETGGYAWVVGDSDFDYQYPTLSLVSDRLDYHPGEVATLLLNTNLVTPNSRKASKRAGKPGAQEPPTYSQAWALITVEGERLYTSWVSPLTSRSTTWKLPLPERYFPSIEVSVTLIQEKQIYQQQIRLAVQREDQKLTVRIKPDRPKFAPGETAGYMVETSDYRGSPVAAEVGLGVVDAAIYAIQPDTTPEIEGFFYGGQAARIATDFSFAAQYSGGAFQTMPASPPQGGQTDIRVRRQFADTAYWNPSVLTGSDGRAHVAFTLPDNLTTWRATARGLTNITQVGSNTCDTVSTMPLLVRLSLPRFYVQGDTTTVSAITHNYTGITRHVTVRIEAEGAEVQGAATHLITLNSDSEQRLDWQAHIRPDAVGTVRFRVTADGGEGAQDAVEMTLPVRMDGVPQVEAHSDVLNGQRRTYTQDLSALPPDSALTITLAPSLAASLFDALDELTAYPYGCAEQTMSSLLPNVIVAQALRRLNVARTVHPHLSEWVNLGLQKLYRYQHADGGWNWWEFDETDGDMTAYVLWGLLQARDAGYLVDEQRILRGIGALQQLLSHEQEWSRRTEWILTLIYANPIPTQKPLQDLFVHRDKLDSYGLASLTLALARAGSVDALPADARARFQSEARLVANTLEGRAVRRGTTVSWSPIEGGYTWRNDDVALTAHVLRALPATDPNSALIPGAIRWLMGNRSGRAWATTRDSAEAVFALAQAMEQTHELNPNFQATVQLDGQSVKTAAFTVQNVFDSPTTVMLSPAQWHGNRTLRVSLQGEGTLYLVVRSAYTTPSAQAVPIRQGIEVQRYYHLLTEDPSLAGQVTSGEQMQVDLEITTDTDYRYVMLEEPIPSGCEVGPGDDRMQPEGLVFAEGAGGYVRQEVRDNRVVFFFDQLPRGRTRLSYQLHAETPGLYRILPNVAELVYFPEIHGSGKPVRAHIVERTIEREESRP